MTCQLIQLPKITDNRGNLTFLQYPNQLPFEIKRVFWTYDIPSNSQRGGHAYLTQNEVIVAISGSFNVILTDKDDSRRSVFLNSPNIGLYIPAKQWRHLERFSGNAISLHLSSSIYNPYDYVRDYKDYKKI